MIKDLPKGFINNMTKLLGEGANNFFDAMDRPAIKAMTVDYNKISLAEFETKYKDMISDHVDGIDNGYYYSGKIGDTLVHHAGVVYSQDASAMFPVEALCINNHDVVLDVCSAPGGKSVQILEKLNNTGLLVANEYVYSRAKILYENLTRFGYRNYAITNNLPKAFDTKVEVFDKILVDAPCSGEGMFRKSDIDTYSWNEANVKACAVRQLEILHSVSGCLKLGGRLVYSTCTYNVTENEGVVVEFLRSHPDYILIDLPDNVRTNTSRGVVIDDEYDTTKCGRRYPHIHIGEGQFVACMMRVGDNVRDEVEWDSDDYVLLRDRDVAKIQSKLRDVTHIPNRLVRKGINVFCLPDVDMDYTGLNVLSMGVLLGQDTGKDFSISHNYYRAYCDTFDRKVDLDDAKASIYLTGNVVTVDAPSGVCAVTYNHLPLGGGKVVGETLKNYYPKELRKLFA